MNILITGSTGFLGNFLSSHLDESNQITNLNSHNCNLYYENILNQYNKNNYDVIFHLAAWTQAGDFCLRYPGDQWVNNQKINTNLLSWWKAKQPKAKLVIIGTSCVYDENLELIEDNYMKGEPTKSLYTYAMTKKMLLQGARSLAEQYDMNYICFVPSTLYGPNYHTDGRQMHFIFDLIRKIIRGKELHEPVVLWGDGYQKREIIYVNDFILNMLALLKKYNNEIFNIGSGIGYSIREYANIICKIINYDSNKIKYDINKYVGVRSKILNIKKVSTALGSEYMNINMKIGLENTIKWFYDNESWR